ncbi:MAG: hypothetical protein IPI72_15995 [Flavobacteriales bacterium]|nr:hypothetical protein [Flavobacteriales bacterium]
MSDRVFTLLIERLRAIASRKQRFSYDVRGNSYVNADLVAAYDVPVGKDGLPDLEVVLQHALDNDAVVSGYRDPADGKMWYSSCRIFTDRYNAVTFAKAQGKATVYNWNRWEEIVVNETVERSASPRLEPLITSTLR